VAGGGQGLGLEELLSKTRTRLARVAACGSGVRRRVAGRENWFVTI